MSGKLYFPILLSIYINSYKLLTCYDWMSQKHWPSDITSSAGSLSIACYRPLIYRFAVIVLLSCNVWWTATLGKLGDRKVKGRWKRRLKANSPNVYMWVISSEVWPQQKCTPILGNEPRHSHASTAEVRHTIEQACLVYSAMLSLWSLLGCPADYYCKNQHHHLKKGFLPAEIPEKYAYAASGMTFL